MSRRTANEARRRAPNRESLIRRQAQDAVGPLREQIAAQQLRAARLATLARRGELGKLGAQSGPLFSGLDGLRAQFAILERELAPDVVASPEVRDAGRALERLAANIAALRAMLDGQSVSSTSGAS